LLHRRIGTEIETALGRRQWSWLAKETGIAPSTLSTQRAKKKFSVDTLCRIARVLELDLNELLCVGRRAS
jgi:DNA-binding Xre family transcriptional regulator